MRNTLLIILANLALIACSKKDIQPTNNLDYSQVKLKSATHSSATFSGATTSSSFDTSTYTYEGTSINYDVRRSTGSAISYKITLNNGLYTQQGYSGNVPSNVKIYYQLNTAGLVEKNWVSNNGNISQSTTYLYNPDKTKALETSDYTSYINVTRPHYLNGTAVYADFERISNSPNISYVNDSVTYEYYSNLPYKADFYSTGFPVPIVGAPAKNLLKKTTYYNKLNNNVIRQTLEYDYETDRDGLITKKIFSLYTYPGKVMSLTDTTTYTYYK